MDTNDTKAGLLVIGMSTIAAIVGAYAGHVPMPHNPIHLPLEKSFSAAVFLPEGWKFFTRDPREETTVVMIRTPDGWTPIPGLTTGSAENALGASRKGRARNVELGQLMEQVPKTEWRECRGAPAACLDGVTTPLHLKAVHKKPQLCGVHGIVAQKPVPWAWRDADPPVVMPSRVLLVEVQC